jgi:hypothetical protein
VHSSAYGPSGATPSRSGHSFVGGRQKRPHRAASQAPPAGRGASTERSHTERGSTSIPLPEWALTPETAPQVGTRVRFVNTDRTMSGVEFKEGELGIVTEARFTPMGPVFVTVRTLDGAQATDRHALLLPSPTLSHGANSGNGAATRGLAILGAHASGSR